MKGPNSSKDIYITSTHKEKNRELSLISIIKIESINYNLQTQKMTDPDDYTSECIQHLGRNNTNSIYYLPENISRRNIFQLRPAYLNTKF